MFARILAAALALALLVPSRSYAQAHDPTLRFETLSTTHFRIHYYQGLGRVAQRIANAGEAVYEHVGGLMGWRTRQVVEVMLLDNTDDGNGNAIPVPYNTIHLWIAAPEDLSELGEYDDYLQQLITHEFTHIDHMDNITGLPALVNAILGKIYPPNAAQPAWILEGIAVYSETRNTGGGRLRSSYWNMFMRADALNDQFNSLDQLSSEGPDRWPYGDMYYLYGSFFIDYITRRFGEQALAQISSYYGGQLIPAGINRAVQRATGSTYEQLYPQFLADLRERFTAERVAVEARGLREGEQITHQGELLRYPRFLPDGHTVAYQASDGMTHTMFRTIDVGAVGGPIARPINSDWSEATSGWGLSPDGTRMVLSDTGFFRDIYFYRDLYERRTELTARGGLITHDNHAISDGLRAEYPDISPDDDHIAFTSQHRGTSTLFEMSSTDHISHQLLRVREYEQVYTPRYSPDGREIVFSQWQRGGYRDIRILDRASGAVRDITHDRAVDYEPIFSPDGRYVVWSSDRTGIANIYAMELATGTIRQVTNVLYGAYMPTLSPDGNTLVYVGYGPRGWDLYRMPFNPALWIDPGAERAYGTPWIETPPVASHVEPYSPLRTLLPHAFSLQLTNDGFGEQIGMITQGTDITGIHSYRALLEFGLVRGDPSFDLQYTYSGLWPTLSLHLYRSVTLARWNVGVWSPSYPQDLWGGSAALSVSFPSLFTSNSVAFDYEAQFVGILGRLPTDQFFDPSELATYPPFRGWVAGVRASWSFSQAFRYGQSISLQEGYGAVVSVHATDPALGSSDASFDASFALAGYVPMPWAPWRKHHVLALRVAGGMGVSDQGARAIYAEGGFPTYGFTDFISSFISLSTTYGVALRGYPQYSRQGNTFYLLDAEYRFLIWDLEHGVSTFPIYIDKLYGAVTCDVGDAFFGPLVASHAAIGLGAELLTDITVGWYFTYTLRLGLARGLSGGDATTQFYALLAAPF